MGIAIKLPVVSGIISEKVQGEVADMEQSLDKEFGHLKEKSNLELLSDMPKQGIPAETISAMMDRVAEVGKGTYISLAKIRISTSLVPFSDR